MSGPRSSVTPAPASPPLPPAAAPPVSVVPSKPRAVPELALENYAFIAAQLAVQTDRPRRQVLADFGLDEPTWEAIVAEWTQRMVDEIRARSASTAPIAERYPLTSSYATAYARAVREAQEDLDRGENEATVRIAPGTPLDEPFSLLGASNRAAEAAKTKGKTP